MPHRWANSQGSTLPLALKTGSTRPSCDRVGEIRAALENLVPVLAKTWGMCRDGEVAGFKSGYGEGTVGTLQESLAIEHFNAPLSTSNMACPN